MKRKALHNSKLKNSPAVQHGTHGTPPATPIIPCKIIMSPLKINEKLIPFQTASFPNVCQ